MSSRTQSVVWLFGRGCSVACGLNWAVPNWFKFLPRKWKIFLIKFFISRELMYSSHSLSSRLTEQDELLSFSQQRESDKGGVLAPQGVAGAGFKLLSRLGRVVRLGIDCGLRVCMGRAGQWQ
jgi:hypothetical protein